MDDEDRRVQVALFRYGCIAELLQRKLPRGEQTRILQRLANQEWEAPGGEKVRLSVSALKSWLARYRKGGFEALKRKPRKDRGKPRALTPTLIERAARLKRELPARSVPQIIRMLEADPNSGVAKGSISRATLHRHLHALGLARKQPGPRRVYQRFEREQPGELWQIDQADGIFLPDPRRPGKDATIRIGSNRYQVDPELRDRQKVEVRYDPFDLTRVEVWVDGRFYQVAVPLTLNKTSLSRSTESAPAPAQLSMSYLKLLRSQHDRHLAEEVERLRFSELPKTSLPGATGGVAPLLALLHLGLGHNLTEAETREAREFWATYGLLDSNLCREALEHACRHLGTGRHISIYLEEIRKRTRR
ncbi:MAG: helix-turn-helix domain-containing protein [Firmicutes bacterium]|nr:helix-turn-helix domain-containing protein [Candidatus Fermentithermobacillaceae bacterium]